MTDDDQSFKMHINLKSATSVFNALSRNSSIRHSIVASIPACHAGDRGSIPRDGT